MTRIKIDYDEWYPVYTYSPSDAKRSTIEVDEATLQKISRAFARFDEAQQLLIELYDKS